MKIALESLVTSVREHVVQQADKYFPEFSGGTWKIRVGKIQQRRFAALCVLWIEGKQRCGLSIQRKLLLKITLAPGECGGAEHATSDHAMLRMFATPDPPGAEHRAMTAISRMVEACDDARIFGVRVLDCLFDDRVLLLEYVDAVPLSQLLLGASRLRRGRVTPSLRESCERAGVLLRVFHEQPVSPYRGERGTTWDDFLAWVEASGRMLSDCTFGRKIVGRIVPRMFEAAERFLPVRLSSVPLHDDFAPRNLLVDHRGCVGMIDMLDEWAGCPWEDVGHFLFSLSANKPQALTGGRFFSPVVVEDLRNAFLSGYYPDEPVPLDELLLFETQITLSNWAAQWQRLRRGSRWRGSVQRAKLAVSMRWFASHIAACLDRIDGASEIHRPRKATHTDMVTGGTP